MNSNVVGPNQIIKVGPMQVDKLNAPFMTPDQALTA